MSETVHGTTVLVGARGVLLRGASGAGKSLLAALLIDRGAQLVADDRVYLSACHGRIIATAPSATAGRLELRGRGILSFSHERSAVIRLVVDIVGETDLERLPDADQFSCVLLAVTLPRQPVAAVSAAAVMLVEAALRAVPSPADMGLRSARVWG